MNADPNHCIVMTTCAGRAEAEALAQQIVEARLAACVQMTDVVSVYTWRNAVHKDPEVLMLMKTRADRYPELEAFIARHHTYEVPEIVRLPLDGGSARYLGWVDAMTGPIASD